MRQSLAETRTTGTLSIDYEVALRSQDYLSVVFTEETMGVDPPSAHPSASVFTATFDLSSGHLLQLRDLASDEGNFYLALGSQVWDRVRSRFGDFRLKPREFFASPGSYEAFTLSTDTLQIHFSACLVAPCVAGPVVVEIPYGSIVEHVQERFPLRNRN